jgi:hypothetical protein
MNLLRQNILSVLAVMTVLFAGSLTASADSTTETWYVTYNFVYHDAAGKEVSETATESMDVTFGDDNSVAFNFPNPITGNAWMRGTKDNEGDLTFPSGQVIGRYGSDIAYYCGSDGEKLTDITFLYDAESNSYIATSLILINSSKTTISAWGYFTTAVVSKEASSNGIIKLSKDHRSKANSAYYDLQGRRVDHPTKGLYIVNGRKVLVK